MKRQFLYHSISQIQNKLNWISPCSLFLRHSFSTTTFLRFSPCLNFLLSWLFGSENLVYAVRSISPIAVPSMSIVHDRQIFSNLVFACPKVFLCLCFYICCHHHLFPLLGIDINYLRYHSYLQMDRNFALLLVLLIVTVGFLIGFLSGLLLSKYSCTRGSPSTVPIMAVPAPKPLIRGSSEVIFIVLIYCSKKTAHF